MKPSSFIVFSERAVRFGVLGALVFAPLAFGAVHTWAQSVVWAVLWLCILLWLCRIWITRKPEAGDWEIRYVSFPFQPLIVLFGLWVLFQCVPLPAGLAEAIQSEPIGTYRLAAGMIGATPVAFPLSIYPHASLVGMFHLFSYAAVFYLLLYHLKTRNHLKLFAYAWTASGIFQALYGMMEGLGGAHRIWWWIAPEIKSVTGTFINRNHLAGYLEMTILITIALILANTSVVRVNNRIGVRGRLLVMTKDNRWMALIVLSLFCILMGAALLMSRSRGGVLSLSLVFVPVSVMLFARRETRKYGAVGLLIAAGMVIVAAPLGLDPLFKRFQDLDRDLGGRWFLWRDTWDLARALPWAGTGWGTFEWVYPRFKGPEFGMRVVSHAHNDWLELLAETGVIGFLIVSAGLGVYLIRGFAVVRSRRDRWSIWAGYGALAAVIVVGVHGVGEFLAHIPANAMTLAAVMAWGWVAMHHHRRGRGRESIRWKTNAFEIPGWTGHLGMAVLVAAHFLIGAGMFRHVSAEFVAPTERNSTIERKAVRDIGRIRKAIDLEPGNAKRWAMLAAELQSQGVSPETESWAAKRGVRAYGSRDDDASWARACLQKAIRLNPSNPDLYERMAWVLASRREWREEGLAEKALDTAVCLEPANGLRYFHLGHYYLLGGRDREAKEAFDKAVELAPVLKRHVDREWERFSTPASKSGTPKTH